MRVAPASAGGDPQVEQLGRALFAENSRLSGALQIGYRITVGAVIDAPKGKAFIRYIFFRRAQVQKVARARRFDQSFNWFGFGKTYANEMLYLPQARYRCPDGAIVSWGAPCAIAALTHGRNAPFDILEDVPAHVYAQVQAGVAQALSVGVHVIDNGLLIGRRLGLTEEMRRDLRVWLLWPANMTTAEFEARYEARRSNDAASKRRRRRAAGIKPREQYEAESIAEKARALGLKPDTLRARLRRIGPVTPHVACPSNANNIDSWCADRDATKRYTIAEQARSMGLTPGALRARLHREKRRAQHRPPPDSGHSSDTEKRALLCEPPDGLNAIGLPGSIPPLAAKVLAEPQRSLLVNPSSLIHGAAGVGRLLE